MLGRLAIPVVRFLKQEEGPTAVEYAVMLALIVAVCFAAISNIGTTTNSMYNNLSLKTSLSGSGS
jgi:pilus assembly protein Flp/PilA